MIHTIAELQAYINSLPPASLSLPIATVTYSEDIPSGSVDVFLSDRGLEIIGSADDV